MSKTPKITIILPVYNTEKYIGQAIRSILGQSFQDFEFIILDDASTDTSYEICREYALQDMRVKLLRNAKNFWVVKTRNILLWEVSPKSKYIALMDADDVSDILRIQKQFQFLEKNSDISLVWSNIKIINSRWEQIWKRKYLKTHTEISKNIFKKSPLAQPAVMIRKKDLDRIWGYNQDFERCQDYELWCRFYEAGYKMYNIQENLLSYRVFPEQGKIKHLKLTLKNTIKIQKKYIFQKKYFGSWNVIYFVCENILLFFPNRFIMWLFKKTQY